jgi:D-amino-acid dehydrogenase
MSHVVVIGGGAIGTACAHYLSLADCDVTLLDLGEQGKGATSGNCGHLAYSHLQPLSEPGIIWKTLKAMGRGNSPLYIKPRVDPALWSWLLNFARHCNESSVLRLTRALQPLIESSESLYQELMDESSLDCEWDEHGSLYVFRTERGMEEFAEKDRMLTEEFGLSAVRYDDEALVELEPAFRPGTTTGAWLYKDDRHLHPEKLLASWRVLLEENGVTVREHCPAKELVQNGREVSTVVTDQGEISADAIVIASGAWAPLLNKQLGCSIPVQPGKGYSITMARPTRCPKYLLHLSDDSVVVTPMESGYRLGSTMEFSGYDPSLNRHRLNRLVEGAAKYLHGPEGECITEEWYGWRPMTHDNLPIIDRAPKMDNVFIATGHNMYGLTAATSTGKLIAEMVMGTSPHIDVQPYSLNRF